jgi:hypothetical protein
MVAIIPPATSDTDPFWAENRAEFLAQRSTAADPTACGTCRSKAEAGERVEHDGCQQRATLVYAPDHPYYEILAGFSLEENAKLPARFHVPVFDDCGVPNAWLCAVCQEEGTATLWPCATAIKYGKQVFTPLHEAETAQKKQAARIAALEAQVERLSARVSRMSSSDIAARTNQPEDDGPLCTCGHGQDRHYTDTTMGQAPRRGCYDCPAGSHQFERAGGAA